MTDLDDKRVFLEAGLEPPQVFAILRLVLKRPGKLDQNGAQPARF